MITVLVFVGAVLAAWLHYHLIGWAVIPGLISVYVAAYTVVFVTAAGVALRSKRSAPMWAAIWLAAYFAAGHFLWRHGATLEARAIEHIGFAAIFVLAFRSRAAMLIAGLFLAMFAADMAAAYGMLATAADRPRVFLAWSHPDVLALLGHGASIVLGIWSDTGASSIVLDRPALRAVRAER